MIPEPRVRVYPQDDTGYLLTVKTIVMGGHCDGFPEPDQREDFGNYCTMSLPVQFFEGSRSCEPVQR